MSEAFEQSIGRVDLSKYIDQLEDEIGRILKDTGMGKTEGEVEAGKRRIEEVVRKQAAALAKETGVGGSYAFVFMLMSSVLASAWAAFALKRGMLDMARPFEERIKLEELLSGMGVVLSDVIAKSANYADMYKKK